MQRRATLPLLLASLLILLVSAGLRLVDYVPPPLAPDRTATTAPRVFVGDWYELALTDPGSASSGTREDSLDQRLIALIDRADSTIDVAIYGFNLANVAAALAGATERQVRVRIVTDSDYSTHDQASRDVFARLAGAGIEIVGDGRRELMHHKFMVVDREWVQTGSWNYTHSDTHRANNNQLIARSRELAENYTVEFEKMFVERRFGPRKRPGVPHPRFTIGGARVENYFAPGDNVSARLIEAIDREANRKLVFLAFAFTHDRLGEAVVRKAQSGVLAQGVFEGDSAGNEHSEYNRMKQAGIEVHPDGSSWLMHHKVMVLDERMVIFGSYNFSNNADRDNDENVLLIEDPSLARAFQAEYDHLAYLARNPVARAR